MQTKTTSISKIAKEFISKLYFPSRDVLKHPADQTLRQLDIIKATQLGNSVRHKVKITFEDDENVKIVHTTVWAVTEERVVLKKGVVIPIHRIHGVKFI